MIYATLKRTKTSDKGTIGELLIVDEEFAAYEFYTLEPPDKNNQRDISCIPVGEYLVTQRNSPKHGLCLKVWGVPGRDEILVHVGNWLINTEGCILPGTERRVGFSLVLSVKYSRRALNKLLDIIGEKGCKLTICAAY